MNSLWPLHTAVGAANVFAANYDVTANSFNTIFPSNRYSKSSESKQFSYIPSLTNEIVSVQQTSGDRIKKRLPRERFLPLIVSYLAQGRCELYSLRFTVLGGL